MKWAMVGVSAWLLAVAPWPAETGQWQVISGDGTEVTSACIGSNESATCLTETAIACSAWSETMMDSRDGRNHQAPICDSPGLLRYHHAVYVIVPKDLTRYLYRLEIWALAEADIPAEMQRTEFPPVWLAGDTVVEIHSINCMPDWACLKRTGTARDAGFGAGCPITSCVGPPWMPEIYYGVEYDVPGAWLIVRREGAGWRVVGEYTAGSQGSNPAEFWRPERWRLAPD